MLNFSVNVNLDIKRTQYPIYFERRNVCIHCGGSGTLTFVDKFGNETNKEIYPLDHIKCKKCGRRYSIRWEKDPSNGRMFPIPVEREIKQEFINTINHIYIKQNGEKKL